MIEAYFSIINEKALASRMQRSDTRQKAPEKRASSEPTLIPGVISDTLTSFMVVIFLGSKRGQVS